MIRSSSFLLLILMVVICGSCYKDSRKGECATEPVFDGQNQCRSVEGEIRGFRTGRSVYAPSFKPSDADQLVYLDIYRNREELVHYTVSTGEKRTLFTSRKLSIPYYGSHGWIGMVGGVDGLGATFIHESGDTSFSWPIRSQLTYVAWNHSSNRFSAKATWVDENTRSYSILVDWPSLEIDTLYYYHEKKGFWKAYWGNEDHLIYAVVGNQVLEFDISQTTRSPSRVVVDYDQVKTKYGGIGNWLTWDVEDRGFYYERFGALLFFDVHEHEEVLIKKSCDSWYYYELAPIPDGSGLLTARRTTTVTNRGMVDKVKMDFYLMDLNGCNERPLFDE